MAETCSTFAFDVLARGLQQHAIAADHAMRSTLELTSMSMPESRHGPLYFSQLNDL